MAKAQVNACHCGSGNAFESCCGRFFRGPEAPATAEQLMRSRYSAYVLKNTAYLAATWHPDTRPELLKLDENPAPHWIGLKILRHEAQDETHAIVEFIARYKINGRAFKMQETSCFVREKGQWFYMDGEVKE